MDGVDAIPDSCPTRPDSPQGRRVSGVRKTVRRELAEAVGQLSDVDVAQLLEVARAFHSFFEACPVLKAEPATRDSRLALCDLASRVLARGLGLLGIRVPERM